MTEVVSGLVILLVTLLTMNVSSISSKLFKLGAKTVKVNIFDGSVCADVDNKKICKNFYNIELSSDEKE